MELMAYTELVGELASPEITESRKTEILLILQEDYKEQHDTLNNLNSVKNDYEVQIKDLTHAHSIMFRKMGGEIAGTKEQIKQIDHSEKITLEEIEKGMF